MSLRHNVIIYLGSIAAISVVALCATVIIKIRLDRNNESLALQAVTNNKNDIILSTQRKNQLENKYLEPVSKIDTSDAPCKATYSRFLGIRNGQSLSEVNDLMGGCSGQLLAQSGMSGNTVKTYEWRGDNYASLQIITNNGRVLSFAQSGLR